MAEDAPAHDAAVDEEALLAERVEDFQERYRKGEPVSVAGYAARFPDMEEELLALLPSVVEMESLGRDSRPPAPALASYPDHLGDYHLLNKLGSGGMGTVFRAMQESLKREVAVKVLAPAWNADARHSEAFENESRLIAGLRHTNIVEVYGAGREGAYRYYVMALVRGRGLSAGQLRRCLPDVSYERAVAEVGLQAARALAYAHSHGVLHRDVKPGNLLLDDDGVLHVSDFGLATALNAGEAAPLVTQSLDGTLRYMAPERLMKGVNSYAGDQYSLGLTLYELLAGRPAFGESEPGKLIHTICHSSVPPLRDKGELGAIVNKAVSYDENDRYASMDAMVADLRRYLDGRPVLARPASFLRRYLLWLRRRPAVAAWSHAAALLVLLLLASVSWGYLSVSRALGNENEQRRLAENNAQIADAALLRIFSSLSRGDTAALASGEGTDFAENVPSHADARLLQDLLPYYEEIVAQANQGDEKVLRACRILADIALQVEEYAVAETYYRRICDMAEPYTPGHMEACNGLACALFNQGKGEDARAFLEKTLKDLPADAPYEVRLAAVRGMQLVAGLGGVQTLRPPAGPSAETQGGKRPPQQRPRMSERREWVERAARLLADLLKERPDNATARLRQVELLSFIRGGDIRKLLAPNGENAFSLLTDLLKQHPDEEEYQLAYLRLALFGHRYMEEDALKRATDYAGKLLAARPGDSERIMLYLSSRDCYAASLSRKGDAAGAARENERTLGVLEHLTSRADFTPELRERLIALVSHRPGVGREDTQRDAELRTLLHNYDENRLLTLRRLFHERRPEARPRFQQGGMMHRGNGQRGRQKENPQVPGEEPAERK